MFNILIINQSGGTGKTTIADELAFALERKEQTVNFFSIDAQGGNVHEHNTRPNADFQIIDTAGVLTDSIGEWCRSADMVIIPTLPSPRDQEPTMRTYELARKSKTKAPIGFIINRYYAPGVLDRQLEEYLQSQGCRIWTKIPKVVALDQAAAHEMSIADYDKSNVAVQVFDDLAEIVIQQAKL